MPDTNNQPFIGVGYHASFPIHADHAAPEHEKVLRDRWMECRPAFARVTHNWGWDRDFAVRQMKMMQDAGTRLYLTTWNPEAYTDPADVAAYGEKVAVMLGDLVHGAGLTNIEWYCMSNEMSMPSESGWGGLYPDQLPRHKAYHEAIFNALQKRNVPVGLLATDASPMERWDSITWAGEHMDDITAAYGGHHYINNFVPGDPAFYPWFTSRIERVADMARIKAKPFIMGEFGPRQHTAGYNPSRYGYEKWDGCAYFNTPVEPLAALQTAETVIGALNAGVNAIGYWTFADYPDPADKKYANKWGTVIWDKNSSFERRQVYFVMGLLSRFFRGPGTIRVVKGIPEKVRAVMLEGEEGNRTALVNWNREPVSLNGMHGTMYQYCAMQPEKYAPYAGLLEATRRDAVQDDAVILPGHSFTIVTESN